MMVADRRSQGPGGQWAMPLQFLAYLIILCLRNGAPNRNIVARLKPHVLAPQNFGLTTLLVANVLYEKCVFFKYFKGWTAEDLSLDSVLGAILRARGQYSFPSAGSLGELNATVTTCLRIFGLRRFFLLA